MRTVHWLFVISLLLFVSGVGLVIAAERTARAAAPGATAEQPRAARPVATTVQIMNGIVMPSAAAVWDSVATFVTDKGVEEHVPRTEAEWEQVATSAAMLVEAANLLVDGDRAIDRGEWLKTAQAMAASAEKALAAATAKSPKGILDAGDEIYRTCNACHETYSRE